MTSETTYNGIPYTEIKRLRLAALRAIQDGAEMASPDDGYESLAAALRKHALRALNEPERQTMRMTFNGVDTAELFAVLDEIDRRRPGPEPYDVRLRQWLDFRDGLHGVKP